MKQLIGIQVLRVIAATAVIFSHALGRANRTFPELQGAVEIPFPNMAVFGHFGVDLFFVISGFVMIYVHSDMYGQIGAPYNFLRKRVKRVVPIYWLLTAIAVLLLLGRPDVFSYRSGIEWDWVIASFLFIPWETSYGLDSPVLGVGWTLNYEMYFYFLFAVSLFFSRRVGLLAMMIFLVISAVIGFYLKIDEPLVEMLVSPLLLEFVCGCLLAVAFLKTQGKVFRHGKFLAACGAVILGVSFFRMPDSHLDRLIWWGGPSALLLAGFLGMEWSKSRGISAVARLGDASYSAYLIQVFSLPAIAMVFKWLNFNEYFGLMGIALLMVVITWVMSVVFWGLVEKRIGRMLATRA